MSLRFRPSRSAAPFRFRTLFLIWALCAAVASPAAWQSLSVSLRGENARLAAADDASTVAPTGWMWESFSPDGRQSALNAGRLVPASQEARLVPARAAKSVTDGAAAAPPPHFSLSLPLPEPELAPAAWDCGDPSPRLPAVRGLFCRPPPSLKA